MTIKTEFMDGFEMWTGAETCPINEANYPASAQYQGGLDCPWYVALTQTFGGLEADIEPVAENEATGHNMTSFCENGRLVLGKYKGGFPMCASWSSRYGLPYRVENFSEPSPDPGNGLTMLPDGSSTVDTWPHYCSHVALKAEFSLAGVSTAYKPYNTIMFAVDFRYRTKDSTDYEFQDARCVFYKKGGDDTGVYYNFFSGGSVPPRFIGTDATAYQMNPFDFQTGGDPLSQLGSDLVLDLPNQNIDWANYMADNRNPTLIGGGVGTDLDGNLMLAKALEVVNGKLYVFYGYYFSRKVGEDPLETYSYGLLAVYDADTLTYEADYGLTTQYLGSPAASFGFQVDATFGEGDFFVLAFDTPIDRELGSTEELRVWRYNVDGTFVTSWTVDTELKNLSFDSNGPAVLLETYLGWTKGLMYHPQTGEIWVMAAEGVGDAVPGRGVGDHAYAAYDVNGTFLRYDYINHSGSEWDLDGICAGVNMEYSSPFWANAEGLGKNIYHGFGRERSTIPTNRPDVIKHFTGPMCDDGLYLWSISRNNINNEDSIFRISLQGEPLYNIEGAWKDGRPAVAQTPLAFGVEHNIEILNNAIWSDLLTGSPSVFADVYVEGVQKLSGATYTLDRRTHPQSVVADRTDRAEFVSLEKFAYAHHNQFEKGYIDDFVFRQADDVADDPTTMILTDWTIHTIRSTQAVGDFRLQPSAEGVSNIRLAMDNDTPSLANIDNATEVVYGLAQFEDDTQQVSYSAPTITGSIVSVSHHVYFAKEGLNPFNLDGYVTDFNNANYHRMGLHYGFKLGETVTLEPAYLHNDAYAGFLGNDTVWGSPLANVQCAGTNVMCSDLNPLGATWSASDVGSMTLQMTAAFDPWITAFRFEDIV